MRQTLEPDHEVGSATSRTDRNPPPPPRDLIAPRAVALARVAYDTSSKPCAAVATELRSLLAGLDRRLPDRFGLDALSFSGRAAKADAGAAERPEALSLGTWLEQFNGPASLLEPVMDGDEVRFTVDPLLGPGLEQGFAAILLLPTERLTDDKDRVALAAHLGRTTSLVTRVLLVFIEGEGPGLPASMDSRARARWTAELLGDGRRHVVALLAGTRSERGLPVEFAGMAEALAQSLLADLVTVRAGGLRPISGGPEGRSGLFVLGARAVRFDPQRVGARLAPRLAADLLAATLYFPEPLRLEDASVPRSALHALREFLPAPSRGAPSFLLHDDARRAGDAPALLGSSLCATAQAGALVESTRLDGVPLDRWPQAIYEWDRVVRRGRLPRWLDRVSSAVAAGSATEAALVDDQATLALASAGGATGQPSTLAAIDDRIRLEYEEIEVTSGRAGSLDDDIHTLTEALSDLPHAPSVLLRAGLLAALQLALGLPMLLLGATGFAQFLGASLLVLAAATWATALLRLQMGTAKATAAKDAALLGVEERCGKALLNAAARGLRTIAERLHEHVDGLRRNSKCALAELHALRTPSHVADAGDRPSAAVLHVPPARRDEEIYGVLARASGGPLSEEGKQGFLDWLRGAARPALSGDVAPSALGEAVLAWCSTRSRQAASDGLSLSRLASGGHLHGEAYGELGRVREHLLAPPYGGYFACSPVTSELLHRSPLDGELFLIGPENLAILHPHLGRQSMDASGASGSSRFIEGADDNIALAIRLLEITP